MNFFKKEQAPQPELHTSPPDAGRLALLRSMARLANGGHVPTPEENAAMLAAGRNEKNMAATLQDIKDLPETHEHDD
jgi:hypothetical protein